MKKGWEGVVNYREYKVNFHSRWYCRMKILLNAPPDYQSRVSQAQKNVCVPPGNISPPLSHFWTAFSNWQNERKDSSDTSEGETTLKIQSNVIGYELATLQFRFTIFSVGSSALPPRETSVNWSSSYPHRLHVPACLKSKICSWSNQKVTRF